MLVSSLVHDLVADSAIEFLESRDVELKGLDGTHRLFRRGHVTTVSEAFDRRLVAE